MEKPNTENALMRSSDFAEELGIVELDIRLDLSFDPLLALAVAKPTQPAPNTGNCGNCAFLC